MAKIKKESENILNFINDDEVIPMSLEMKHHFVSLGLSVSWLTHSHFFLKQLGNILDDKCAGNCGKPIRASDFVFRDERRGFFVHGMCPTCYAKWMAEIEKLCPNFTFPSY